MLYLHYLYSFQPPLIDSKIYCQLTYLNFKNTKINSENNKSIIYIKLFYIQMF